MPDPLTINLQIAQPLRGSNVGVWDVPVNSDWSIIDTAFGSVTSVGLSNVNVNLTVSQAQAAVLRLSGALTGNVLITLPAIIKSWTVQNLTTGAFVPILTTGLGNVIGLPPGAPTDVFSDGTNLYFKNLGQIGTYEDYAGATLPAWVLACTTLPYLPCDGTTFSAGTYPVLNVILGTTTLPDLRGRSRFFLNGGTGRVTPAGSAIDGDTRFSAGGAQNVTLSLPQTPSATLNGTTQAPNGVNLNGVFASSKNNDTLTGGSGASFLSGGASAVELSLLTTHTHNVSINNGGGNQPHTNMPPAQISGITMIRAG